VTITLLDLVGRPRETVLDFLKDSLPPPGGIMQIIGIGTIVDEFDQNDELFSILGFFIRVTFYQGSPYLLVLLDCRSWNMAHFLKIDWNVTCRDMGPSMDSVKAYLDNCAESLTISKDVLLPIASGKFDLAKVESLLLSIEKMLSEHGANEPERSKVVLEHVQQFQGLPNLDDGSLDDTL
jgi:hypothetical protein